MLNKALPECRKICWISAARMSEDLMDQAAGMSGNVLEQSRPDDEGSEML